MTALSLLAVLLCAVVVIGGSVWLTSAMYKDGYRHGYSDGLFDAEFPEFASGPMIPPREAT